MKLLPHFAALLIGLPISASAQGSVEREARAFLLAYDKAVAGRDIAFLERALADDYVLTGASGRKSDRIQVLNYYRRERERPSYRRISLQHDNVVVRAVSNMAVVTNDYMSQTAPLDEPRAEPETTRGRHTGVFAKRGGRWVVIAEQDTEQPHDDKVMERQVAKSGRDLNELVMHLMDRRRTEPQQSADTAAFSRIVADGFSCTCGADRITRKAEVIQLYRNSRAALDTVELIEQSVMPIDNNAAIETGKLRYSGKDAAGRVDVAKRYTRTWVSWGRGWQVIVEHSSVVEK